MFTFFRLKKRRHWSEEQKDIALVRASRGIRPESQEVVAMLLQEGASVSSIRAGSTSLCEAVKSGALSTKHDLLLQLNNLPRMEVF